MENIMTKLETTFYMLLVFESKDSTMFDMVKILDKSAGRLCPSDRPGVLIDSEGPGLLLGFTTSTRG